MNNNFGRCLALTLIYEGGYSDHPADPGGATNFGITRRTLAAWRGQAVSKEEVRALTKAEASAIYRKNYWDEVGGDSIPIGPDLCTFDEGVNAGPSRGKSRYQSARAKVSSPAAIVKAMCAGRRSFLQGLGTFKTFGKGWMARVANVEATAYRWALTAQGMAPADVGKTMRDEGKVASQTATKKATQAKTAGGGAVATGSGGAGVIQWNWEGIAFLAVVVGVIAFIAFLAWRAHRAQQERAEAFAAESVHG